MVTRPKGKIAYLQAYDHRTIGTSKSTQSGRSPVTVDIYFRNTYVLARPRARRGGRRQQVEVLKRKIVFFKSGPLCVQRSRRNIVPHALCFHIAISVAVIPLLCIDGDSTRGNPCICRVGVRKRGEKEKSFVTFASDVVMWYWYGFAC